MAREYARTGAFLIATLLVTTTSACFLAAAGAGAGGAIYVTSRGAESLVEAGVARVERATSDTFGELGIVTTGTTTEKGGDEAQMRGKRGELDVTVNIERESPSTTKIEVTARKNVAEWDKDFAKRVLETIVRRSS